MAAITRNHSSLAKRVQAQFGILTLQFLAGMAVNLLGTPDEHTNAIKLLSGSLFLLHVLLAIGLIVNAVLIVRLVAGASESVMGFARGAGVAVGSATLFGILTVTGPWRDFWSYLMAVAFIASFALYGRLFSEAKLA